MADSDLDSESSSSQVSSGAGGSVLLRELAYVAPIVGALHEVVLPTPLRGVPGDQPIAPEAVPPLGSIVDGRYRLDAVLGAGGMGVVFAAQHLQTGKSVALKWLSPTRGQRGSRGRAQALARFAREARAAGRIRHPNVVDVYDASSTEEAPYLVMERLEGETLRARIERAPLAWEELLTLLLPALHGVAELHRQGIVHRDLKPDNVFLARIHGSPEPCAKVLDFGVSLLRSPDAHEDSLTGTGAVLGTPSYMPLEQLRGAENVDERTDVYALGVVLFEALAGKRPWQARSAGEYGALLASARPTRLSALKPALKGAREAAIMRALEREPEDRYPSVDAMIAALLAASRPPDPRRVWAALALLATALLLLLGVWPSHRVRSELNVPVRSAAAPIAATSAHAFATPVPVPARPPAPATRDGAPPEQLSMPVPIALPEAKLRSVSPRHARTHRAPTARTRTLEARPAPSPFPASTPVPPPTDRATSLVRSDF